MTRDITVLWLIGAIALLSAVITLGLLTPLSTPKRVLAFVASAVIGALVVLWMFQDKRWCIMIPLWMIALAVVASVLWNVIVIARYRAKSRLASASNGR